MGFDPVSYLMGKEAGGGGGSSVTVEALTVTENGTVTAPDGKAYSPVTVDVPQRDPYLYENVYTVQLSRIANTWTGDPTITVDCAKMKNMSNMCNGGGGNPGYKKIKLINIPTNGVSFNNAFMGHDDSAFETLELSGNLVSTTSVNAAFDGNRSIKTVIGGSLDLSAATSASNFARKAEKLETISFVPSSIKVSIYFNGANSLSDASLVSICNGLDGTVSGQTLTLDTSKKTRCGEIVGTVTDGVFSIDAQGGTTLLDFATVTKGWTVA